MILHSNLSDTLRGGLGVLIIVLSLVLTAAAIAFKAWRFRRRWKVDRFGGVLVRFDRGATLTPELGAVLKVANGELMQLLWEEAPLPRNFEWRVEVVPPGEVRTPTITNGRFPDGSIIGGSVRAERAAPFVTPVFVVVVCADEVDPPHTARLIAHEVCRHVAPFVIEKNADRLHRLAVYAALETEAKKAIGNALRRPV